jgi:hypothetical protein
MFGFKQLWFIKNEKLMKRIITFYKSGFFINDFKK